LNIEIGMDIEVIEIEYLASWSELGKQIKLIKLAQRINENDSHQVLDFGGKFFGVFVIRDKYYAILLFAKKS